MVGIALGYNSSPVFPKNKEILDLLQKELQNKKPFAITAENFIEYLNFFPTNAIDYRDLWQIQVNLVTANDSIDQKKYKLAFTEWISVQYHRIDLLLNMEIEPGISYLDSLVSIRCKHTAEDRATASTAIIQAYLASFKNVLLHVLEQNINQLDDSFFASNTRDKQITAQKTAYSSVFDTTTFTPGPTYYKNTFNKISLFRLMTKLIGLEAQSFYGYLLTKFQTAAKQDNLSEHDFNAIESELTSALKQYVIQTIIKAGNFNKETPVEAIYKHFYQLNNEKFMVQHYAELIFTKKPEDTLYSFYNQYEIPTRLELAQQVLFTLHVIPTEQQANSPIIDYTNSYEQLFRQEKAQKAATSADNMVKTINDFAGHVGLGIQVKSQNELLHEETQELQQRYNQMTTPQLKSQIVSAHTRELLGKRPALTGQQLAQRVATQRKKLLEKSAASRKFQSMSNKELEITLGQAAVAEIVKAQEKPYHEQLKAKDQEEQNLFIESEKEVIKSFGSIEVVESTKHKTDPTPPIGKKDPKKSSSTAPNAKASTTAASDSEDEEITAPILSSSKSAINKRMVPKKITDITAAEVEKKFDKNPVTVIRGKLVNYVRELPESQAREIGSKLNIKEADITKLKMKLVDEYSKLHHLQLLTNQSVEQKLSTQYENVSIKNLEAQLSSTVIQTIKATEHNVKDDYSTTNFGGTTTDTNIRSLAQTQKIENFAKKSISQLKTELIDLHWQQHYKTQLVKKITQAERQRIQYSVISTQELETMLSTPVVALKADITALKAQKNTKKEEIVKEYITDASLHADAAKRNIKNPQTMPLTDVKEKVSELRWQEYYREQLIQLADTSVQLHLNHDARKTKSTTETIDALEKRMSAHALQDIHTEQKKNYRASLIEKAREYETSLSTTYQTYQKKTVPQLEEILVPKPKKELQLEADVEEIIKAKFTSKIKEDVAKLRRPELETQIEKKRIVVDRTSSDQVLKDELGNFLSEQAWQTLYKPQLRSSGQLEIEALLALKDKFTAKYTSVMQNKTLGQLQAEATSKNISHYRTNDLIDAIADAYWAKIESPKTAPTEQLTGKSKPEVIQLLEPKIKQLYKDSLATTDLYELRDLARSKGIDIHDGSKTDQQLKDSLADKYKDSLASKNINELRILAASQHIDDSSKTEQELKDLLTGKYKDNLPANSYDLKLLATSNGIDDGSKTAQELKDLLADKYWKGFDNFGSLQNTAQSVINFLKGKFIELYKAQLTSKNLSHLLAIAESENITEDFLKTDVLLRVDLAETYWQDTYKQLLIVKLLECEYANLSDAELATLSGNLLLEEIQEQTSAAPNADVKLKQELVKTALKQEIDSRKSHPRTTEQLTPEVALPSVVTIVDHDKVTHSKFDTVKSIVDRITTTLFYQGKSGHYQNSELNSQGACAVNRELSPAEEKEISKQLIASVSKSEQNDLNHTKQLFKKTTNTFNKLITMFTSLSSATSIVTPTAIPTNNGPKKQSILNKNAILANIDEKIQQVSATLLPKGGSHLSVKDIYAYLYQQGANEQFIVQEIIDLIKQQNGSNLLKDVTDANGKVLPLHEFYSQNCNVDGVEDTLEFYTRQLIAQEILKRQNPNFDHATIEGTVKFFEQSYRQTVAAEMHMEAKQVAHELNKSAAYVGDRIALSATPTDPANYIDNRSTLTPKQGTMREITRETYDTLFNPDKDGAYATGKRLSPAERKEVAKTVDDILTPDRKKILGEFSNVFGKLWKEFTLLIEKAGHAVTSKKVTMKAPVPLDYVEARVVPEVFQYKEITVESPLPKPVITKSIELASESQQQIRNILCPPTISSPAP